MKDDISRRSFLKMAGLASSLLAAEACRPERGTKLIPYLVPEDNVIPGVPAFYRTICRACSAGCGVVARVREGRVIKLEGNPDHPVNAGALCARGQAALQGLYNPDRLPRPRLRVGKAAFEDISWDDAIKVVASRCKQAANHSNQVAFLGNPRGPSFHKLLENFLAGFNSNRFFYFEPLTETAAVQATKDCFTRTDLPSYRIDKAEVLISFGADFLETWRSPVEYSRQFAAFRTPRHGDRRSSPIGLSYYVGPYMSLTAAKSDYYFSCAPGTEGAIALAILRSMDDQRLVGNFPDLARLKQFLAPFAPSDVEHRTEFPAQIIRRIAKDFATAPAALALASSSDPALHRATYLMNAVTGNLNRTLFFPKTLPMAATSTSQLGLRPLIQAMLSGEIMVLVIAGSNPVFTTSEELRFEAALQRVPLVVWCGGVPDETAELAHLMLPIHDPLEDWSDEAAGSGVFTLGQPAMAPVFHSRSLGDVLLETARLAGQSPPWPNMQAVVEQNWQALGERYSKPQDNEDFWTRARHTGGLFLSPDFAAVQFNSSVLDTPPDLPNVSSQLMLLSYPHIFLYDGRGADKSWLQENPEPVSQLVWNSWLQIHPDTAKQFGIREDDLVEVSSTYGSVIVSARLDPRVWRRAVVMPLGQGHSAYGRYARNRGANPWPILPPDQLAIPVVLRRTGQIRKLISPLYSSDMMNRPIVEKISLEDFIEGKKPPPDEPPPPEPYELWPGRVFPEHNWGMTIDLNSCTGCGACVTACYAENNLNVVGETGVRNGRIMSWLRLERYFPQELDAPQIYLMPMLCQQCSSAPCEPVCPVYASYHTAEGLNAQIYNRCVGTRYCENNCPYKVRRFNWFKPEFDAPLHLQLNPDVTVRGEGVMEKCTFCVQRIRAAEISAKIEDRQVHDGEIIPACAQTCASRAIVFGDINDSRSAMMRARSQNAIRNYRALEQLNTKPSIVYLRTIYRSRKA
jgi:molybdopterin-containing oxidoreductase family iron-sulfur binding subunit